MHTIVITYNGIAKSGPGRACACPTPVEMAKPHQYILIEQSVPIHGPPENHTGIIMLLSILAE